LRRSPIPIKATEMRQANDHLDITRTSGSTARLQHSSGPLVAGRTLSIGGPI